MKGKLSKQAQTLTEISPILKVCLIHRLSETDSLKLFEDNGIKMSASSLYRYKKEYNESAGNRYIDLVRHEWAEEHLLVLDTIKELERCYWELFEECDEKMDAKHVLDSIRALQGEKIMIYNETPMLSRMKEIMEEKIRELTKRPELK